MFLLPETHNKVLMDTIDHAGEFVSYNKTVVELEAEIHPSTIREDKEAWIIGSDDVIVEAASKAPIHVSTIDECREATVIMNDEVTEQLETGNHISANDRDVLTRNNEVVLEPGALAHTTSSTRDDEATTIANGQVVQ